MKTKFTSIILALAAIGLNLPANAYSPAALPAPLPEFMDEAQTAKWNASLTASVAPTSANQPSTQFYTGKPYVAEAGGYVFKYRTYKPEMSRWTSADPSGFPDGVNNQAYAPVPTQAFDYQGLVSITFTTSDYDGLGVTNASISYLAGTVITQKTADGHCWVAVMKTPSTWTGVGTIQLPKVGDSLVNPTNSAQTGTFTQAFHNDVSTHENWHATHDNDAATVTYTALYNWTNAYTSNQFQTEAEALAAGNADFTNAYTVASNAFSDFYTRSGNHEGGGSLGWNFDATNNTYTETNPSWGSAFDATINAYKINFTKTTGNCE